MKIAIVSVGIGNVASVKNLLEAIGHRATLCETPAEFDHECLVIPGVGSFDAGITKLRHYGWYDWLTTGKLSKSTPLIGICLGMQLLCSGSEEGKLAGLGLIPGTFKKFPTDTSVGNRLRVPNMGWLSINFTDGKGWGDLGSDVNQPRFYFVHSYYYDYPTKDFQVATASHGFDYPVIIANGNTIGIQFHPEKSHKYGKALLKKILGTYEAT